MCSIFGILSVKHDLTHLQQKAIRCSSLMRHRGPDWSGIYTNKKVILIHERLSIVDIHSGAQPLYNTSRTNILAINGEIYNHKEIRSKLNNYNYQTNSDCEVILALYQNKKINFFNELRGMFAFVLYDTELNAYLIGRDHVGIIPLYMGNDKDGNVYVASEMKALVPMCCFIKEFPPSSYLWSQDGIIKNYYQRDWFKYDNVKNNLTNTTLLKSALEKSVKSHLMADVPYGVLLSGGLDSSVISFIVKKFFNQANHTENKTFLPKLHSFAIGLKKSPDLYAAKKIADFLNLKHHEINFTIQEGLDLIRNVIYYIETYDITTVRASIPMYLMSKKIKSTGIKMVLSGEGADEIFGGYLYFYHAPNAQALHEELVRKIQALHMYDCIRANKAMLAWGVETRLPFLDKDFMDIAMRINPKDKICINNRIEKQVLRECFHKDLPASLIWRKKEQFSDGVGYNWIDSLKENANLLINDQKFANAYLRFPYNTPFSKEGYLYREIFEELFPLSSAAECVPGGSSVACSSAQAISWDESFKKNNDPSGRSISIHNASY